RSFVAEPFKTCSALPCRRSTAAGSRLAIFPIVAVYFGTGDCTEDCCGNCSYLGTRLVVIWVACFRREKAVEKASINACLLEVRMLEDSAKERQVGLDSTHKLFIQ